MEFRFVTRTDGIIEAHVDDAGFLLNEALNDAVSSRAPRGAVHQGLSTYWIDRAEDGTRQAIQKGNNKPFATGNVTYLRLDGDHVVAGYDFDSDEVDAERMPVENFLAVLAEWRRRVVDAGGASGPMAALMSVPAERPTDPGS